jgi:hypothetical protein
MDRESYLTISGSVNGSARNRLVDVEVAVADLEVEAAVGIGTHPGFVVDGRALATEIRQRHEVPGLAFLALGKAGKIHDFDHPWGTILFPAGTVPEWPEYSRAYVKVTIDSRPAT